jgi:tripartite-type tricarboxylate transporter receptor subunit TctC
MTHPNRRRLTLTLAILMLATLLQVQSGKPKVLGVSTATRVPLLANVPTTAEQGVRGFASSTWQGGVKIN